MKKNQERNETDLPAEKLSNNSRIFELIAFQDEKCCTDEKKVNHGE